MLWRVFFFLIGFRRKVKDLRPKCSQSFETQWLQYVPPGLTFQDFAFSPHSLFVCRLGFSNKEWIYS